MSEFKIINSLEDIKLSNRWTDATKLDPENGVLGDVVDENGMPPVSTDYQGRRYRVVSIKERAYSFPERVGRGFLGVVAVVSSLCLALLLRYKSVRGLFTEQRSTIRFGTLILDSTVVQKNGTDQTSQTKTKQQPKVQSVFTQIKRRIYAKLYPLPSNPKPTFQIGGDFSKPPREINEYILEFVLPPVPSKPSELTFAAIKERGRVLTELSQVSHELRSICYSRISECRRTLDLLRKYKEYEGDADFPQLYDALMSGCSLVFARSTFGGYNVKIERDIKELVKLLPSSINCPVGQLRCRDSVTPLHAACANTKIPIQMVEFLLQNGADSKVIVDVDGRKVQLLADLKVNLDNTRYSEIEKLFNKYNTGS